MGLRAFEREPQTQENREENDVEEQEERGGPIFCIHVKKKVSSVNQIEQGKYTGPLFWKNPTLSCEAQATANRTWLSSPTSRWLEPASKSFIPLYRRLGRVMRILLSTFVRAHGPA